MTTQLGQLAQMHVGYSFRSGIEPSGQGKVRVVQMKDVADSSVSLESLATVEDLGFKEHHWVQSGDLVFRSRGGSFKTIVISTAPGPMILAAPLIRIRPEPAVSPAFLNWYFTLASTQSQLAERSRGTTQLMVGIDDLKQLRIEVPDLDTQEAIVSIVFLQERESTLSERLIGLRRRLVTHFLESAIHTNRSHR